jgi:pyruvate,water dikinase
MISGIVTEIGGTISHGAVIAREYGIPCLIAVENACKTFKTGDIVMLDAEVGEIVKVE